MAKARRHGKHRCHPKPRSPAAGTMGQDLALLLPDYPSARWYQSDATSGDELDEILRMAYPVLPMPSANPIRPRENTSP